MSEGGFSGSKASTSFSGIPIADFRASPLSRNARSHIAGLAESIAATGRIPPSRAKLLGLLTSAAFNKDNGIYIPFSDYVEIKSKGPDYSCRVSGPSLPVPVSLLCQWSPDPPGIRFGRVRPKLWPRTDSAADHVGFQILTIEFDCQTLDQLEENLLCTRDESGLLAEFDRRMCRFSDYRGVCAVYSGDRSVHFHVVIWTEHLTEVRWDASAEDRLGPNQAHHAAVLKAAHKSAWKVVNETFSEVVRPCMNSDSKMDGPVQFRRTPWGLRVLEQKDHKILGFPDGTRVPQLVLREEIRTRAPRESSEFLISPSFTIPRAQHRPTSNPGRRPLNVDVGEEVIEEIQSMCFMAFGEYPRPVSVDRDSDGWIIRFSNNALDQRPSTVAKADYRSLLLYGKHNFGDRSIFLPEGLTANELVDHAIRMCGREPPDVNKAASEYEDLGQTRGSARLPKHLMVKMLESHFSAPVDGSSASNVQNELRRRVWYAANMLRGIAQRRYHDDASGNRVDEPYRHILLKGPEGLGKTHAVATVLGYEILDDALDRYEGQSVERFGCVAFRSNHQARLKAEEYGKDGFAKVVVITGLNRHYQEACTTVGEEPLPDAVLKGSSQGFVLEIAVRQPEVFKELERRRKAIWSGAAKFNSGCVMLFMNHALAIRWHQSYATRIWHHPDFDPKVPIHDQHHLRDEFPFSKVVIDEPVLDEFLYHCDQPTYERLLALQHQSPNWRNMKRHEREAVFASSEIRSVRNFDEFDEWMRQDLSELEPVSVDSDRIPLSVNTSAGCIYRKMHGKIYHFGVKRWPFNSGVQWHFLTTETLISDVIEFVYEKVGKKSLLLRVDLDIDAGIFPIDVPYVLDKRASSQKIGSLISEKFTSPNRMPRSLRMARMLLV